MEVVFVDTLEQGRLDRDQQIALEQIVEAGDPRLAWPISDMMRFTFRFALTVRLPAASELLGIEYETTIPQNEIVNHLMAWEVPSYPGYLDTKRAIFTSFVPGWDDGSSSRARSTGAWCPGVAS
jgi:hypothetical protein